MSIHFKETQYGFEWGAAKIQRFFSDEKRGWITLGITTPKIELQVYITKTGKVRVFSNGEWQTPKGKQTVQNLDQNE